MAWLPRCRTATAGSAACWSRSCWGHEKVLQRPALYLSHYLKQHRASYYDRLMAIRFAGDWEGWLQPARLAPPRPGHGGEPQEQREQFRAEIPRRVVAADRPPPRPPPSGGHAELRNL